MRQTGTTSRSRTAQGGGEQETGKGGWGDVEADTCLRLQFAWPSLWTSDVDRTSVYHHMICIQWCLVQAILLLLHNASNGKQLPWCGTRAVEVSRNKSLFDLEVPKGFFNIYQTNITSIYHWTICRVWGISINLRLYNTLQKDFVKENVNSRAKPELFWKFYKYLLKNFTPHRRGI